MREGAKMRCEEAKHEDAKKRREGNNWEAKNEDAKKRSEDKKMQRSEAKIRRCEEAKNEEKKKRCEDKKFKL